MYTWERGGQHGGTEEQAGVEERRASRYEDEEGVVMTTGLCCSLTRNGYTLYVTWFGHWFASIELDGGQNSYIIG